MTIHYMELSQQQEDLDVLIAADRTIASDPSIPICDRYYQQEVMRRLEGQAHLARLCGAVSDFDENPIAQVIDMNKYRDN